MKKVLISLALLFSVSVAANAQVSTVKILENIALAVATIEENGGQIVNIQVDYVLKGSNSSNMYYLDKGSTYQIVAIGDSERIGDIDLTVSDDNGNEVGKDHDDKNVAVVKVEPQWGANFTFTVTPYKMADDVNDGFYGIIVVRID
jgi:hypothetical protein